MVEKKVVVKHEVGLHARPASLFVQTANRFTANIKVKNLTTSTEEVDAKSILSILTLGVMRDHEILIRTDGEDAETALQSLCDLVERNFEES